MDDANRMPRFELRRQLIAVLIVQKARKSGLFSDLKIKIRMVQYLRTRSAGLALPLASTGFLRVSGISPSRCAFLRMSLRARRIASDFCRFLRSEGFS